MRDNLYSAIISELRDEIKQFGKGRLLNALEPGEEHDAESGEHTSPHHISGYEEHMEHHEEDPEDNEEDEEDEDRY